MHSKYITINHITILREIPKENLVDLAYGGGDNIKAMLEKGAKGFMGDEKASELIDSEKEKNFSFYFLIGENRFALVPYETDEPLGCWF